VVVAAQPTLQPQPMPKLGHGGQDTYSGAPLGLSHSPVGKKARVKPPKQPRRCLHGVLLLDKPLGWTSNDALQKAKGILRAEKGGHTGTLDPLATGLLPLCFGAATKFSQVSLDADKRYTATLRLGQRTTTGDAEGDVTQEREVNTTGAAIEAACKQLTGDIEQTPPMYSALKVNGKALYEYARSGIELERAKRRITIYSIHIVEYADTSLTLDIRCSKGTYIRTLAEDLGELLGCGAHLSALRRTASGPLKLSDAITLEQLQDMTEAEREARLLPPESLVAEWPCVELAADEAARFLCGLRRRVSSPDTPAVRVFAQAPRAFLGSAHITQGELIADRLLSPTEVRATP
jgi:tRNA pseudouridine55 synthase